MTNVQPNQKITPFLWFNTEAEEAATFYTGIFKNSSIKSVTHYPDLRGMQKGVMTVVFEIAGQEFVGLNAGPNFPFTEAISFAIHCKDQDEIDYFWNVLTANGGQESVCGWLKDKYGLSWQIIPEKLNTWLQGADPDKTAAIMAEVMKMKKLEIGILQEAFDHGA